jgi:hypothetical protein
VTAGAPALTKLTYLTRLRGAGLTPAEHTVLVTMLTYARKDLTGARPGWARLCADTELSRNTVKQAVRRLICGGFLVLTEQGGNVVGHGRSNVYTLRLPLSTRGQPTDPYDEDEGVNWLTPKGSNRTREGVKRPLSRGQWADPHQGSTSSGSNVIIPHAMHAGPADAGRARHPDDVLLWLDTTMIGFWGPMLDDYDELEAWLEGDIGLDDDEHSTASGMWEDGRHPVAIRNTILKQRREAS